MIAVTAPDLRNLIASPQGTRLVLEEGQLLVAPPVQGAEHAGAMTVIRREDLVDRIGDEPDEHALAEQAQLLSTEISELGA